MESIGYEAAPLTLRMEELSEMVDRRESLSLVKRGRAGLLRLGSSGACFGEVYR